MGLSGCHNMILSSLFCELYTWYLFFFFKQKTAYEMRISDWSSDVCSSDLTIRDGIDYGKQRPLADAKKIEKAQTFLRREDGSYEFLASNEEMTDYEVAVINGTLEMGLPTGLNWLNEYWMFKKHHIVWLVGDRKSTRLNSSH